MANLKYLGSPLFILFFSVSFGPSAAAASACNGVKMEKLNLGQSQERRMSEAKKLCGPKMDGKGGDLEKSLSQVSTQSSVCFQGRMAGNAQNKSAFEKKVNENKDNNAKACQRVKDDIESLEKICQQQAATAKEVGSHAPIGDSQQGAFDGAILNHSVAQESYNDLSVAARGAELKAEATIKGLRNRQFEKSREMQSIVDSQMRAAKNQVDNKLGVRNKYAASSGGQTARFRDQKDVNNFYRQMSKCQQSAKGSIDAYRKQYYDRFVKAAEGLKSDLGGAGKSYESSRDLHDGERLKLVTSKSRLRDSGSAEGSTASGISGGERDPASK